MRRGSGAWFFLPLAELIAPMALNGDRWVGGPGRGAMAAAEQRYYPFNLGGRRGGEHRSKLGDVLGQIAALRFARA